MGVYFLRDSNSIASVIRQEKYSIITNLLLKKELQQPSSILLLLFLITEEVSDAYSFRKSRVCWLWSDAKNTNRNPSIIIHLDQLLRTHNYKCDMLMYSALQGSPLRYIVEWARIWNIIVYYIYTMYSPNATTILIIFQCGMLGKNI